MPELKKVLIVDDERLSRVSIRKMGRWQSLGAKVVGEARNGQEAYEMTRTLAPDVIITDMKMPGVDGMILMEWLTRDFPRIRLIIISGYDNFAYMHSAITNKAVDYILKPIDWKQLNDALKRAIDESKGLLQVGRDDSAMMADVRRYILEKELNEIICGKRVQKESCVELSDIDLFRNHCFANVLILLKLCEQAGDVEGLSGSVDLDRDIYNCICSVLEEAGGRSEYIVFKMQQSDFEYCILLGHKHILDEDYAEYAKLIATTVMESLSRDFCFTGLTGISTSYDSLDELAAMYLEARAALMSINLFNSARLAQYENPTLMEKSKNEVVFDENKWLLAMESGEHKKVERLLEEILAGFSSQRSICPWNIAGLFREIIYLTRKTLYRLNISVAANGTIKRHIADEHNWDLIMGAFPVNDTMDLATLQRGIMDRLSLYIDAVKASRSEKLNPTLYRLKEYLDTCFYEKINLEKLSQKFYFSKTYLSRAFKEEFGQNISNYLIGVRINKAREYIMNSRMTLTEIMKLTGFNNLNYFGKVYKKYFSKTPSEEKSQYSSSVLGKPVSCHFSCFVIRLL